MWSPTHVQVTVQRARGLLTKGKNKTNDCFVTISLGKEKYQTSVKEKASNNAEWHEECEIQIPQQGNTAEIVLTAYHRNFLGVDEFLGTVSIPLSSFDVYERPRNRWYPLNGKPGKENVKKRGELEVKIGFIVKAGSLMDLTKKERHKNSLGQLSSAAQSIGGSLLSMGSLEKRNGLKKLAKSIGKKVKAKKNMIEQNDLDERHEFHFRPTKQEPNDADPGVISEDEDELTFDAISVKSSHSSLNAPSIGKSNEIPEGIRGTSGRQTDNDTIWMSASSNIIPDRSPRTTIDSSLSPTKVGIQQEDEWSRKLYGKKGGSTLKRWGNEPNVFIGVEESKIENELSKSPSPLPVPRISCEIISSHNNDGRERSLLNPKEDKCLARSPQEKQKKERRKEMDQRIDDNSCSSSERIIIGGEDAIQNNINNKNRLPHEVLSRFEGKSREDLIEFILQLQAEVTDSKKRVHDLEDYIDELLLRVLECSPRLLQNPFQGRRSSSPGHR